MRFGIDPFVSRESLSILNMKCESDEESRAAAESKKNHGVWDPMPELTIISPYAHSRVDSNTFTMGNPMPESTLKGQ